MEEPDTSHEIELSPTSTDNAKVEVESESVVNVKSKEVGEVRVSSQEIFPLQRRSIHQQNQPTGHESTVNRSLSQERSDLDNVQRPYRKSSVASWGHDDSGNKLTVAQRWIERSRRNARAIMKIPGVSYVVRWTKGPTPSRSYRIQPLLPNLQSFPAVALSRWLPHELGSILAVFVICVLWLIAFSVTLSSYSKTSIKNRAGTDDNAPVRLSCIARLWDDAPSCGLDGRYCQPFAGASFPFICPSNCGSVKVLNPVNIGDQEINYRNLVVGGPSANNASLSVYRGDSFICPAAVHAGIISNTYGGCAVLNREGLQSNFPSVDRNGILSIAFQPSFPLSFSIGSAAGNCQDPQWYVLAASVCATVLISLVATLPALFFSTVFVITFFQVGLASDAPWGSDYASVVSIGFERFLPAAFVGIVVYRYAIKRTMQDLSAYWERTILWIGGCWVGALNSYTFDRIPLSRLTSHDIKNQPGAIVALVILVLVIIAAVAGQIWTSRNEGRLLRYLRSYIIVGIVIGCLNAIPSLTFRLHHYVLALLLLPLTSTQTRPSLLYQGILMGLFINGIARWGFSSILQTSAVLLKGAQLGSDLPEVLDPKIISDTISLTITELADGFDGLSIIVNDIERFQMTNVSLPVVFNWTRTVKDEMTFFRFAFTGTYRTGGIWYGDYTNAGTWFANGTWKAILYD